MEQARKAVRVRQFDESRKKKTLLSYKKIINKKKKKS